MFSPAKSFPEIKLEQKPETTMLYNIKVPESDEYDIWYILGSDTADQFHIFHFCLSAIVVIPLSYLSSPLLGSLILHCWQEMSGENQRIQHLPSSSSIPPLQPSYGVSLDQLIVFAEQLILNAANIAIEQWPSECCIYHNSTLITRFAWNVPLDHMTSDSI